MEVKPSKTYGGKKYSLRSSHLGKVLYKQLEEGKNVDVYFLCGGPLEGKIRLPVHKLVLFSSTLEFEKMLYKKIQINDLNLSIISLPEDFSPQVVKTFIKALYLDNFSETDTLSVILEVLRFADMFIVREVIILCAEVIKNMMDNDNYLDIWNATKSNKYCLLTIKHLRDKCLNFFTKSVITNDSLLWDASIWKQILERDNVGDLTEVQSFNSLLKWKNHDEKREEEFKSLTHLVRFPQMDLQSLLTIIGLSEILNSEEMLSLIYYSTGTSCKSITKFNKKPRSNRIKIAYNSEQLVLLLNSAEPGDWIYLTEAQYEGSFEIKTHNLLIQGMSEGKTKIYLPDDCSVFKINSNYVTISNLSITCKSISSIKFSSNTTLSNITFYNCGIEASGNFNEFKDLKFISSSGIHPKACMKMHGHTNVISNVELSNFKYGIIIKNDNDLRDITLSKVHQGINVYGNGNKISQVIYNCKNIASFPNETPIAIVIDGGNKNVVDSVRCEGYNKNFPLFSIGLYVGLFDENGDGNRDNSFSKIGPGSVQLRGENNLLKDVDCGLGSFLDVEGVGHQLINCKSNDLRKGDPCTDVKVVSCNFTI